MENNYSEIRYRRLFETLHIGIIILDFKDRTIVDANPYIARLSGYTKKELMGQKISTVKLFDHALTGKGIFYALRNNPEVSYENIPLTTKTGGTKIVQVSAHTYREEGKTLIQCTIRDVTEKREAQRELFETNKRLEALMNALPVGVAFSMDTKAENIKANPYLAKKMRVASEDNISVTADDPHAVGRKLRHFVNGRELKPHELPMQKAIRTNKIVGPFEGEVELPSGKRWTVESIGAPIHDKNGKVVGAVSVNVDLTERKKAEEADKLALVVSQEKEKLDFIADAAHELRTPIAIIRGNVDLALSKKMKEDEALKSINTEVLHLTDLLSDLSLLTTKYADFRRRMGTRRLDLGNMLKTLAKRHQGMADRKSIKIICEKIPPHTVDGDEYYLERLFTNIISNAIAYGKNGGHVWIKGKASGRCIKIMIEDDGGGISENDLPHIFERFYRTDSSRSKDSGGSGLGLAIVKWIAEVHNGSVSASSTLGKGSTFTVSLPMKKKK